jgi:hypothetical protein
MSGDVATKVYPTRDIDNGATVTSVQQGGQFQTHNTVGLSGVNVPSPSGYYNLLTQKLNYPTYYTA